MRGPLNRVGLYIHWPFCQAKCPYCDFNSHVVSRIDQARWRAAFATEISRYKEERPDIEIGSIFFGGGTPSLMEVETVASIIDQAQRAWRFANDVEITLEANPTSVEAERFRGYHAAGVNRISIGVQALNDRDLRMLGRLHSVAEAEAAFGTAREIFPRVSFDLIYARQDQSLAEWEAELGRALGLAADHLSLYQLTIEPGTAFGDRFARGRLAGLPDEDLSADMFELTQDMTTAAGLPAYEVSNHAAPDAESRHNMIYWTGGDYLGIGPGAHGRLATPGGRIATEALSAPGAWLNGTETGKDHEARTPISAREMAEERIMMGLRLKQGLDISEIETELGDTGHLENLGLLVRSGSRMALTPAGRPLLNAILRELLV
ncbi:radical SAM family heme chaperone HemW [Palleronia sp.]|uniref:radical SAM family heme chaperone HemW n=1 Tax=Palleronia sp. TaxID=1940284 RepID=UPI0035C7E04A